MVNFYIYAKDFSGSTGGDEHFHKNGMKSFEEFKRDVEKMEKELSAAGEPPTESKIIYLHWGDICYEVNEDTTKTSYIDLDHGGMGTEPKSIVNWILQNYNIVDENNRIKLLYIITDGLINHRSAQRCFTLNENINYETVVFHAFNEDPSRVDLSVAVSFFKKRCMVYRNYELCDCTDISEEFDYDKINVDNFETEKDNLKSYIRLKYIRKQKHDVIALKEIDKLKKFRNRMLNELSSKTHEDKIKLETKDRNIFLREFIRTDWYKNLSGAAHDSKVDIEKSISTLINYIVNDQKSYSFDALQFDKNYSQPVDEEPIVDVDFTAEQEIEFPDIILDDDKGIPVVILTELNLLNKIIFNKKDELVQVSPARFNKFKSVMGCPLFLINDLDVSESIGYFYTLNVYKQLLANGKMTEPRTRRPFHGGLVLTDTDEFDRYNDYVLSATYFNSKKVHYNIGLFYFVLWKSCEKKEWMDKNVVEQFKKYVLRRISSTVCKIGLSSLPLDPQENTSLLTALWYCVEMSSCIFKDDPRNFMHERLRVRYGVTHCMIEILKYFDYELDLESIEKRRDLIRHVNVLKKIPRRIDKLYYLLEMIFKTADGFLISEIEKPLNLFKLNYLNLNHSDMLRDNVIEDKVHLNEYVHLMHFGVDVNEFETGKNKFEICEKTFRPFFAIGQNKSFYTELVKTTKKVVINNDDDKDKIDVTYHVIDSLEFDKILSLYNLFINCVKDSEKYPTLPEYIEYISKRKKFNDNLVTIFPSNVYIYAKNVHAHYQDIVTKVDDKTFIEVSKAYVSRAERIKAEEVVKFNNDSEINEFITSEEVKVKLIKKKK